MPELRSDKLTKSYNRRVVVKEVNVKIRSGEIIGFLGRNGAGKTTTFQMMAGLIKPNRGSVFLDDKNISLLPSHLRAEAGITYLPQENSVFLKASVKNNLKLVLELLPLKRKEREDIAGKLLEELGRAEEAEVEYERFLEMWADADEGLPQLVDARQRLAALRTRHSP